MMTVEAWLEATLADSERRQLPELKPLLEALAQATRSLRAAEFNCDPAGSEITSPRSPGNEHPNDQITR
jgi:hypothetical protein